jgi:putative transposase
MEEIRVERIVINAGHPNHRACRRYTFATRCIHNAGLYHMRQALFKGEPISHRQADVLLKTQYPDTYQLLPSAGAQRTLQIVGDEWKSRQAAKADFEQHPEKYKARPRLPNDAKQTRTYVVNRNGFKIENGRLYLAGGKDFGFAPMKVTCCRNQRYNARAAETKVGDVRIVPPGASFVIELTYPEVIKEDILLNSANCFSIDLGVNVLAAITSNQPDYIPVLIGGRSIKSINAQYNKDKAALASKGKGRHIKAKSRKRYCRITDYFHKVSTHIIRECLRTDTGTIVIGLSPDWKQAINIGRVNNRKFTSIPHRRLIDMIIYKAARYGIRVIIREESYTSRASALDLDPIPVYEEVKKTGIKPTFSGRRVKRGLYKSGQGRLIHADVNGSANTLRKEIGDEWLIEQLRANRGVMDTPVAVRHIDLLLKGSPRAPEETTSKRAAA